MFSDHSYGTIPHLTPATVDQDNNPYQHHEVPCRAPDSNRHYPEQMYPIAATGAPMQPPTHPMYKTTNPFFYPTISCQAPPPWSCTPDQHTFPEVRSHYNPTYDVGQAVPVTQNGFATWSGGTGSAAITNAAPIHGPPLSPIGFGMVHPRFRQTERRLRALDSRYVNAAKEITKIMSEACASQYFGTILSYDAAIQQSKLTAYVGTLDDDIQAWIANCRSTPTLHRPERSKDKKKSDDYDRLFCCLWCTSTFTVKHNLANHIRSHMDLHISFCDHCDFSSVCSTLPTRHKCTT